MGVRFLSSDTRATTVLCMEMSSQRGDLGVGVLTEDADNPQTKIVSGRIVKRKQTRMLLLLKNLCYWAFPCLLFWGQKFGLHAAFRGWTLRKPVCFFSVCYWKGHATAISHLVVLAFQYSLNETQLRYIFVNSTTVSLRLQVVCMRVRICVSSAPEIIPISLVSGTDSS